MGLFKEKVGRIQRRKRKATRRTNRAVYGVSELIKMPAAQRDMIMNRMTPGELVTLISEAENPSETLLNDLHAFVESTDEKP